MMNPSLSEDRRHSFRLRERTHLGLRFIDPASVKEVTVASTTENIGEGGAKVSTDVPLPSHDRYNFETTLSDALPYILGLGELVWRDDNQKLYGLKFLDIPPQEMLNLRSHVNRFISKTEQVEDRRMGIIERRGKVDDVILEKRTSSRRRFDQDPMTKTLLPPRKKKEEDYQKNVVEERLKWIEQQTGTTLPHLGQFSENPTGMSQNIENLIGTTSIPLGIVGPILIRGTHARGLYYVPMATTQGTLVESYHRGSFLVTKAGGVKVAIHKDEVHISPVFIFKDINASVQFITWLREHEPEIKKSAEQTTHHGKLIRITPIPAGRRIIVNFVYTTGDAMGLNMINIATDHACQWIISETKPESYFLRCNFSSDKKASFYNFIQSYGKEVTAEILLPKKLVLRYLHTEPRAIYEFWYSAVWGSMQAGMIGINAHFANGLAAIFSATGQDIAQVVNASTGLYFVELTPENDLRFTIKLPQLIVATVGGGTSLAPQRESLEIMGCAGPGRVKKFAEIIAGTLLAGEISISGALASGGFAQGDIALRNRGGNNKPKT
ncbi:MAG: PilZ domain-containing protein [Chlamydiae bacterium]|nr:PilZ domain-containing protein [Chlamydiota bacterium]